MGRPPYGQPTQGSLKTTEALLGRGLPPELCVLSDCIVGNEVSSTYV